MARFTVMPSLRDASCWNFEVVNGATGFRRRSFVSTERTAQSARSSAATMRIDCPVFLLFKGANLTLTFDNQSQRNRLYAPGGESAANLVPQQRGNLETDDAIQHAPRLLRVHQVLVDI